MDKLKKIRKEKGYTQLQMAGKMGMSESQYCLLENGKRRMSLKVALDISSILKITPSDIFLPDNFAKSKDDKKTG